MTLHADRRRAGSFGEVAEQYDRVRPEYPVELVDTLLAGGPRTVLDVGCGTGISSRLFIARGCAVVGLEPDPRMAEVARRRGVEVESGTIEEWEAGARRFDLLTAGQSWHWVDPLRGAAKAAAVLRPGGRIGLFWNQAHPDPSIRPVLDAVYARHAPELSRRSVLLGRRDPSLYESGAQSLRATSAFSDVSVVVFGHDVDYAPRRVGRPVRHPQRSPHAPPGPVDRAPGRPAQGDRSAPEAASRSTTRRRWSPGCATEVGLPSHSLFSLGLPSSGTDPATR